MLKVQYISFVQTKAKQLSSILAMLREKHIQLDNYDPNSCTQPCIILCDDISTTDFLFLEPLMKEHKVLLIHFNTHHCHESTRMIYNMGVSDVLNDENLERLASTIKKRLERWHLLNRMVQSVQQNHNIIGNSAPWLQALRELLEAAHFSSTPILLQGETGTGKELLAKIAYDFNSLKNKHAFVIVDATTLSPELAGSELFGHEKGAFTGATTSRSGAVAAAHNGTLFIDEIGDLPLQIQAQLLRLIQEGTYKHLGGNIWRHSKFRLVSATHHDLKTMCKKGTFRSDLFYRIAGSVIKLPPLRNRGDDILSLMKHFLSNVLSCKGQVKLDPSVELHLINRSFSGNVRDIKQMANRIAMRHVADGYITLGDLPKTERSNEDLALNLFKTSFNKVIQSSVMNGHSLKEISELAKNTAINLAMENNSNNIKLVANKLQISVRTLQMRRQNQTQEISSKSIKNI